MRIYESADKIREQHKNKPSSFKESETRFESPYNLQQGLSTLSICY